MSLNEIFVRCLSPKYKEPSHRQQTHTDNSLVRNVAWKNFMSIREVDVH